VPAISLDSVVAVNAPAFGKNNSISAGEVLRVTGKGMGPAAPTPGIVANGAVTASVAGVLVTFDGMRAAARSRTPSVPATSKPLVQCGDGSFVFIDQDEVGFKR